MSRVAGVDIARGAWLVVYLRDGRFDGAEIVERLAGRAIDADVVAVDVPLDLPVGRIGRPAEEEARLLLGPRRSTMFRSLPADLYAGDYSAPNRAAARRRWGESYSKQAWNLRSAVHDAGSARAEGWYETHPELAFLGIQGHALESKKRWSGVRQRLDCLSRVGIEVPLISGDLNPDDALDAAVCAHVADRIASGAANRVPSDGPGPYIWF